MGRAGGRAIGRNLAAVVTLALLGVIGFVGYYERVYQRMAHALDNDVAALRALRWERPALHGAQGEGNAAEEIYAAMAGWQPLGPALRARLADAVFYGQPLAETELQAIQQRGIQLDRLRGSGQQRFARTDLAPELGRAMHVPVYPRLAEAALCLLGQAESAQPDECLRRATEVIRIGQDLVPGAPLEAASTATHLTDLAARVITHCAQTAELAALRRASHELSLMASHPPPIGSSIELEEIATAMELRHRAALSNKDSPWHIVQTLLERPALLAAWSAHDNPTRYRQLSPERYPDAMEEWKREQDFRLQSSAPGVATSAGHVLARLQDDMRGQAILRMLAIGIGTLADRAYRGVLPARPTGLRDNALTDPYRSQPFNYHVAANGTELTLWSVGEDFRDDSGSDDWTGPAPRDVTVHFPLASPAVLAPVARKRP